MDDHTPCPRCHFENARCACPKHVPNPSEFSAEERRALAKQVLDAVHARGHHLSAKDRAKKFRSTRDAYASGVHTRDA